MDSVNLTEEQIDEYLSVCLSNADRVGPAARHHLKGLLEYYAKKQHPFTACVRDNRKRFGNRAEGVCAVLKDIIRGTTKWRGHNNPRDVGTPGLATALSEEQKVEFVLDIPEDIQMFLDELDEDYMNQLKLAAGDVVWSAEDGDGYAINQMNDLREQLNSAINEPETPDPDGDGDIDNYPGSMSFWVVDTNSKDKKALVCEGGDEYWVVPYTVDSDGDVGISDNKEWTSVDKAYVQANMSEEPQMLAEMFFDGSDEEVRLGDDGLIYKTLLREGTWAYSPGPGQIPVAKPITVVKNGNSDGRTRVISMEELKTNFDNKIKDHVTIPLSHDNKVDENTGYIRQVRISEDETGRATLEAGFDFTEPDIKGKVERGSIANTSAGVLFDYIHKESGRKFNAILDHAALTNSPWLNNMKPFGFEASDNLQVVAFSEENNPNNNNGGEVVVSETTVTTEEVITPEDALVTKLGLSEDEITSRLAEYDELKARDKQHDIDAQITEWQDKGVAPAILSEARSILVADDGSVALNLSEDGVTKPFTATQLVARLIETMPVVKLSDEPGNGEQGATDAGKPSEEETNEYTDLSLSEKTDITNMMLYEQVSEKDAVAQVRARREKK